jgi:PIN domain nuclease of toxin-antitoxin system
MDRYLLDTHVLVGLLSGNQDKIPDTVREDIECFRGSYFVSVASFVEIVEKQNKKKTIIVSGTTEEWRLLLSQWNIGVLDVTYEVVNRFETEGIPESQLMQHKDPFDRLIIATALVHKMTLISADRKFPWWQRYRKLKLLYIE